MNKQEHVWKGKEGGMYCVWRTKSLLQRSQTVYKIEKLVKKNLIIHAIHVLSLQRAPIIT